MCWINNSIPDLLTAYVDIPILKVGESKGENVMISPYRGFEYELGKTYCLGQALRVRGTSWYCFVNEGFHSYNSLDVYIHNESWAVLVYKNSHYIINQYPPTVSVFKGIVPEGAHYYINRYGEIVSDKIVILNKL